MKVPTIQIVLDAKGLPLTEGMMSHIEWCVMAIFGSGSYGHKFWILRTDIYHQFIADHFAQRLLPPKIADERFHEPTADLYLADFNNGYPANVPYGRIINLKLPDIA